MVVGKSTAIHAKGFEDVGSLLGGFEGRSKLGDLLLCFGQSTFQIDKVEIAIFKKACRIAKQCGNVLLCKEMSIVNGRRNVSQQ